MIKLKSPGGDVINALSIYSYVSKEQKFSTEWAKYLTNYDQPGGELHAQLDLYSIEDLTCLQTYIRTNYKAKDAVLIEQAQRSIERRIDYGLFFSKTECYKYMLKSPLADPDIESCTWFPDIVGASMTEREVNDLEAHAHTDHQGFHIWVDVKVGQPKIKFKDDLFLERKLPFTKKPNEPEDFDIVDVEGDETKKKKRKRKKKDYEFKFDKDLPSFPLPVEEEIDPKDVLRNLTNDELRKLLKKALERIKDGIPSDDNETGNAIDKTTLALDVLVGTVSEISAWLPASTLAKISASAGFFIFEAVGVIVLPLLGWIVLTIEFRTATEKHRAWGMRIALREGIFALRRLSRSFTVGSIPRRPIKNWIISSNEAVADIWRTDRVPIHAKFHDGYDFLVKELTTLINRVLDEAEKVVHKEFSAIVLSKAKIKILLESGLLDINKVYGKSLMGLSDFLNEELRKIEKHP